MPGVAGSGEWSIPLDKWVGVAEDRFDRATRSATTEMCADIIDETPRDETNPDEVTMRGDWVFGVNTEPADVNRNDKTGDAAQAMLVAVAEKWKPSAGETFIGANYKPYGEMLEYGQYHHDPDSGRTTEEGYSTQAPQGFVGINVERFDDLMNKAVAKESLT